MTKKYRLSDRDNNGLYRIVALCDIPRYGVEAGDKGGFASGKHTLSYKGDCWIGHNARVSGYARVCDNAHVCGNARVWGNVVVTNDATVCDDAYVWGHPQNQTKVGGTAVISGITRLRCGTWETTPKAIRGSKHNVIYNDEQISIGCECHALEWWEENGLEVAEKDGFTPEQIEEYREHLNAIRKEYTDTNNTL